jgi:hypothetical protein
VRRGEEWCPWLADADKSVANRVMGCTNEAWIDVKLNADGTVTLRQELARHFFTTLFISSVTKHGAVDDSRYDPCTLCIPPHACTHVTNRVTPGSE